MRERMRERFSTRFLRELRGGDEIDVSCELAFSDDRTYQVHHEFRVWSSTPAGHASRTRGTTPNLDSLTASRLGTASGNRPGKGAAQRPVVTKVRGQPRCPRSSSD
jgi:hypothetical protein